MRTPPGQPIVFENLWNDSRAEGKVFASVRAFYCPEAQRAFIELEAWIQGDKKGETHAFLDPNAQKAGARSDVATRVLRDATRNQTGDIARNMWQDWTARIRQALAPKVVPSQAPEKTG